MSLSVYMPLLDMGLISLADICYIVDPEYHASLAGTLLFLLSS
jgi:hypothetical protein